jgi:hypothetical protein
MKKTMAVNSSVFIEDKRELGYPTHAYPYTAGLVGGALGGAAMAIPAAAFGLLSGYGIWYPINLVAATVMRGMQNMSRQQLSVFNPAALVVGLIIHLVVASTIGLLFALLLPTLPGRAVVWAVIVGPVLWFAATLIVLPQINPVMSQLLDWPSFAAANLAYGLFMGYWVAETPKVEAELAHHLHFHRPGFLLR